MALNPGANDTDIHRVVMLFHDLAVSLRVVSLACIQASSNLYSAPTQNNRAQAWSQKIGRVNKIDRHPKDTFENETISVLLALAHTCPVLCEVTPWAISD